MTQIIKIQLVECSSKPFNGRIINNASCGNKVELVKGIIRNLDLTLQDIIKIESSTGIPLLNPKIFEKTSLNKFGLPNYDELLNFKR